MKKSGYLLLTVLLALILLTAVGCGKTAEKPSQGKTAAKELTIAGSTSVQPLSELLADAFMKKNPGVKVAVQGGGSGVGIEQVSAGTIDIGSSSRELKPEEKATLKEFLICKDGIAIIVNPQNKVTDLTIEQIKGIYSGKIINWKDVGGENASITVINREAGSGTRGAFEELVMGKDTPMIKSVEQNSTGAVRSAVAADKNAIGYVSLTGLGSDVKAVTVNGIKAEPDTIRAGKYPISRPFLYLTKGEPNALAKKYLDFVASDEGQRIIGKEGLVIVK